MKRKDIKSLHTKTVQELVKDLAGKQKEITKLVTEKGLTQVKNTRSVRVLKDDVARIMTVLAQMKRKETKV